VQSDGPTEQRIGVVESGSDPAFRPKGLFRLSWPLFVVSLLALATTLVDTIILSAYSEDLNATVAVANQILGVVYDIGTLLSIGVLVLTAQHLGRGSRAGAHRVAASAIAGSTALGAVLAAGLLALGPLLVAWVNTPGELRTDAYLYIAVVGVAMVFNGYVVAATAVLRAFGRTGIILTLGIVANVAYLLLQYGLIFGAFGLPELGVLGAALSTFVVRGSAVLLLAWVLRRYLGITWRDVPAFRALRTELRALTRIAWPSTAENVAFNVVQLVLLSLIAVLGVSAILTRSYTLTLTGFVAVLVLALAQGNETIVGWAKGAEDNEGARRQALRTAVIAATAATALAVLSWLGADLLLALFSASDEVVAGVRSLLLISIVTQPFTAATTVFFSSLRSVGDVVAPVLYTFGTTVLIGLPLAVVLVRVADVGVVGLWLALLAAEVVKAIAVTTRWVRMGWASRHLIGARDDDITDGEPSPARS
jgi:putative MATE family efflux protein